MARSRLRSNGASAPVVESRMARRVLLAPSVRRALGPWYSAEVLEGTVLLRGSLFGRLFGAFGQAAVTVRGTVHLTRRAPSLEEPEGLCLAAHELYHVVQQREMGWLRFLARYAWRWRPVHIRQGWRHPLEAPAYARAEEVRRALGGSA